MKSFKEALLIVGGLCFVAAAVYGCFAIYLSTRRWTVFERPIRVEDGSSFSQTFTVDFPDTYEAVITCRNTIPREKLNALLMRDLAAYSVSEGNVRVSEDNVSRHGGWKYFGGILCHFKAKPGQTYRVDVRFNRPSPELAAAQTMIKVRVTFSHSSAAGVEAIIYGMMAVASGIVGIFCAIPFYDAWPTLQRQSIAAANAASS